VGRGNDLERHARFMQILQQTITPEGTLQYLMPTELISRLAAAMGIDTVGLIKTQQQIAEEQAAAQQAAQQQALLQSPVADPQKLATAAATVQDMQQPTEEPAQ
jgi:DNA replication initiation complex subunit (GINS family)